MTQIYEYADVWSFRHGSPQKESFAPLIEIEVDEGVIACLTRPGSRPLDPQQPPGDNIVTAEVYFLKRTFKDLAMAACWHNNIQIVFDAAAAAGPLLGAITWRPIADGVIRPAPPVARQLKTKRANQRRLYHPPPAWQARTLPVGLWLPEADMVDVAQQFPVRGIAERWDTAREGRPAPAPLCKVRGETLGSAYPWLYLVADTEAGLGARSDTRPRTRPPFGKNGWIDHPDQVPTVVL